MAIKGKLDVKTKVLLDKNAFTTVNHPFFDEQKLFCKFHELQLVAHSSCCKHFVSPFSRHVQFSEQPSQIYRIFWWHQVKSVKNKRKLLQLDSIERK